MIYDVQLRMNDIPVGLNGRQVADAWYLGRNGGSSAEMNRLQAEMNGVQAEMDRLQAAMDRLQAALNRLHVKPSRFLVKIHALHLLEFSLHS